VIPGCTDPALHRAVLAARDKRERRGGSGDATVIVARVDDEEALALDGLLSPRRPVLAGGTVRVALSQFEEALRSCGIDPREEYERVGGRPLRDLPAESAARRRLRQSFETWLSEHQVVRAHPGAAVWLEQAIHQGRVHAGLQHVLEPALRILGVLPAPEPLQRTVLAARMLDGDPHGLDVGTPLHAMVIALLAAAGGRDESTPPRTIWADWNVVVDPISSTVAALNLPLMGDGAAARVARTLSGTHVVLTHGQLAGDDVLWPAGIPGFSCENPSVLVAIERALGVSAPAVICTKGYPSDAVRLVLAAVHRAGGRIHHHGDFDEAGVQIFRDLADRYDAVPWRFDIESMRAAVGGRGQHELAPGPQTLEEAVRALTSPLPEELTIDALLADLTSVRESADPGAVAHQLQ
jgi:uncharacterized protein (TIGR02679 family)